MIATGTDVKPLECLVFMRNVKSLGYFEQMKGRGCRIVSPDELTKVTPDAKVKTHFVIVDCVGVCLEEKSATKPLDREPAVPLDKLLDLVSKGVASDDLASSIASKLVRLDQRLDDNQREMIQEASGGRNLQQISADLLTSIDPDKNTELAKTQFSVDEPSDDQVAKVERERVVEALKTFHQPKLREAILGARRSLDQVIDEQTPDVLLKAGFSEEALLKARTMLTSFKKFIEDNKDEIEAIKILYSRPYRAGLRFKHIKELATKLNQPPFYVDPSRPESLVRLWQAYELTEPERVKGTGGKQLVDVVALVKHALDPSTPLAPMGMTVEERYREWLSEKERAGITFTVDQKKWLDAIKDHIASSLAIEQEDLEEVPFNTIGGLGRAYELFGDTLAPILDELNMRLAV
jgi:type I restriction enzyme R subunit